jgi:chromosome segregation ATPase
LADARQKINSLTSALLTRTEELRDLDQQRNEATAELAVAQAREKELTALLSAQQTDNEAQRQQWELEAARARAEAEKLAELVAAGNHPETGRNCQAATETRPSASAVLGSVMEQFGKLRQQRSLNRLNPKPR